ncbi:hypothetical protein HDU97_008179 [Phlyctochytrium planicorne]|nr:hypothetical protein HDU97_008179 [Phlyctochytrium planicorne]
MDSSNPFTKVFLKLHQHSHALPNGTSASSSSGTPKGMKLLHEANVNQGTAYNDQSRSSSAVVGLVPPAIETLDIQVARSIQFLREIREPLQKFLYLDRIRSEDSVLFYKLVSQYLEETVKVIYTPTVGEACQRFSHIYTPGNAQGLFLSLSQKGRIDQVLDSWSASGRPDPQICVMTDGSRILGLGDLGINGMGIPIGKLSLYVAAAGFDPARTLPITLDLGSNTDKIRDDPLYLGTRMKRPADPEFFGFVDEVMKAFQRKWPKMLIQFEDFSSEHAFQTLDRYRYQYPCFNDDIQGTGAVILSGFINAVRESRIPLQSHRILFLGAGSAGVGVASQLCVHFAKTIPGLSLEDAKTHFYLMDSKGLVTSDRSDAARYPDHKKIFMRDDMHGEQIGGLVDAIRRIRPTVLIGLSSQGGVFTEEILRLMGELNQRPIVFPLSNPIQNAECTFSAALLHTQGRVLFASGTAFPPELHPTTRKTVVPGQGNNMYIFPGLGLGAVLGRLTTVSDDVVYQSAATLAESLDDGEIRDGLLYPRIERIREVSALVARDCILAGLREGCVEEPDILGFFNAKAGQPCGPELNDANRKDRLLNYVIRHMWEPVYPKSRM